jgi:hypothetical protein
MESLIAFPSGGALLNNGFADRISIKHYINDIIGDAASSITKGQFLFGTPLMFVVDNKMRVVSEIVPRERENIIQFMGKLDSLSLKSDQSISN